MTQLIQLTDSIWAVEVPEDAKNFQIGKYGLDDILEYEHSYQPNRRLKWLFGCDDLPFGNWQILCTLKECTRWQASEIVESEGNLYYDYILVKGHLQNYTEDPLYSLRSLIKSKGLDTESNILIMQNNSNEQ